MISAPLGPGEMWDPIAPEEFDSGAARHLLRRTSWNASEVEVKRAVDEGLERTLKRLFPSSAATFAKPPEIAALEAQQDELQERLRAGDDEMAKRQLRRELRDRAQRAYQDMVIRWLRFARDPAQAASEKWVLFLSDIYVVAFQKVRNPLLLWQHHDLLRRAGTGSAVELTQAVSRSPAMIEYLDLRQSRRGSPNENFARELFELFVLGEGNYSEADIKEAARAFTGYRQRSGAFRFQKGQHDPTAKTIFGRTGKYDGDGVIQLAYEQPAAATFLPAQLWRYYISDTELEPEAVRALGELWRADRCDLQRLRHRVFSSRAFFDARNRGNLIKSPLQFYLGLLADLALDPSPLPRQVIGSLRQMGQIPFNPPNVRGWVGGRNWINSTTLAARRQLVRSLFVPLETKNLNADEVAALEAAREAGLSRFHLDRPNAAQLAERLLEPSSGKMLEDWIPESFVASYRAILDRGSADFSGETAPELLSSLLQTPAYQLC